LFAIFNPGPAQRVEMPQTAPGWRLILDTTRPAAGPQRVGRSVEAPAQSVLVFDAIDHPGGPR
jgi:glycogen operon protein